MHRVVASWFGTGLILGRLRGSDLGSGTVGALFAFPVAILIGRWWGWVAQLVAAVVVVAASLWSARPFAEDGGDPGWVCVDEAAGAFICVIGLPLSPEAVLAWIVFRAADIWKDLAPGVAQAERRLPGAVGVTADDVVAGLYGLAIGHILMALL
ncbi:MAG TPA: phosphatidylglycerophosphatase A [Acidimicrobiia bacterium]|jgi:phosphatidylglycerophosphatase A|nr:phosphatidylglycerophosphatase A [Acidimicrobiia bacterium]